MQLNVHPEETLTFFGCNT